MLFARKDRSSRSLSSLRRRVVKMIEPCLNVVSLSSARIHFPRNNSEARETRRAAKQWETQYLWRDSAHQTRSGNPGKVKRVCKADRALESIRICKSNSDTGDLDSPAVSDVIKLSSPRGNSRGGRDSSRRGNRGEVRYSKSQCAEGVEGSKFDFQPRAPAIIGQQFFGLPRISFSPSSVSVSRSRLSLGEQQLGQKLRKLVNGRICWKGGYCEWQLAVHYSWITRLPRWDGELAERDENNGGTRGRETERIERDEMSRDACKKGQRYSFPLVTSKTVLTTQQNRARFVALSLNVLSSKDSP